MGHHNLPDETDRLFLTRQFSTSRCSRNGMEWTKICNKAYSFRNSNALYKNIIVQHKDDGFLYKYSFKKLQQTLYITASPRLAKTSSNSLLPFLKHVCVCVYVMVVGGAHTHTVGVTKICRSEDYANIITSDHNYLVLVCPLKIQRRIDNSHYSKRSYVKDFGTILTAGCRTNSHSLA